ncbi:MAG: hypothetical protein ACJ74Y_11310 [Bryobacteraceae bacterium]
MKLRYALLSLTVLGLLSAGTLAAAPQSAGQDMKDAGKKTTSAVKKGTTKSTRAAKKGTHKAADETEKGVDKVKDKTTNTSTH